MTGADTLRTALRSLDRVGARWAGIYSFLHLTERLVLVGAALWFVQGKGTRTMLLAAALSAIVVVRAAVRTALMGHLQADLHRRAVDKLLEGDLLSASALRDDDVEASVLEGIASGTRLLGAIVPEFAADALATVVIAVVLFMVEPLRLLAAGAAAVLCAGGGVLVANRIGRREEQRSWLAYRPVIDGLITTIGARLEIVANGVSGPFSEGRRDEIEAWKRTTRRSTMLVALASRLPLGVAVFLVGGIVLAQRAWQHELTTSMFAHAALFAVSLPAIAGLGRNSLEVTQHSVRFAPLAALLDASSLPRGMGESAPSLPATIAWEDVSIRYAGAKDCAISGIDLTWHPGSVLVLRGPNGSGKSTLLRTLLAVSPCESGIVRVAGAPLEEANLARWRDGIAYLAQKPFLPFRGTVEGAFQILAPDAEAADIEEALGRMGLLEVLLRRDRDAPLAVDVGTLSVGERQRLALARVLVRKKPLVLFDEPDANLDRAGIDVLCATIRELAAEGRMIAIAAHTDEMIGLGDQIVTLSRGHVVRG